jgi:phosphatidylserine synthase
VLLWAMPLITLAAGMLMVSRIRYAHIANRYLRGRRPWGMIFWFLLLLAVFVVYPQMVMVIITASYAVSGPIGAAYRRFVPVAAGEGPVAVGGLHEPSDDGRRGEAIKPPSDSMRP